MNSGKRNGVFRVVFDHFVFSVKFSTAIQNVDHKVPLKNNTITLYCLIWQNTRDRFFNSQKC